MKLATCRLKMGAAVAGTMLSLLLAGCGAINGTSDPTPFDPTGATSTMSGVTRGGYNPISGAVVTMYAAGSSYGTATAIANVASTGSDGSFSFTADPISTNANSGTHYNCTANGVTGTTQMYLTARGGNTTGSGGSSGNSASVLAVALGQCGNLTSATRVIINEATTVAMIYAMQQFINVTSTNVLVGAPSTLASGLANAYQISQLLVNAGNGTINTSLTVNSTPSGNSSSVTMTITPESTKLVTLANLLANCVNQTDSSKSPCTTLLTNAVAPTLATTNQTPAATATAASDTAMATWYMATNPTLSQDSLTTGATRMTAIYTASSGYQPFGIAGLSAQPSDWTVDIVYSAGSSKCSYGTQTPRPFAVPFQMAIDANGSIWINNSTSTTSPAIVQVSQSGQMPTCYTDPNYSNGLLGASIVVDTQNNVWYTIAGTVSSGTDSGGGIYEIAGGTGTPTSVDMTKLSAGFQPYQLVALKNGDLVASSYLSESSGGYHAAQYVNAAVNGTSVAPSTVAAAGGRNYSWVAAYTASASTIPFLYEDGASIYALVPTGSTPPVSAWAYVSGARVTPSPQSACANIGSAPGPPGLASVSNGNVVGAGCANTGGTIAEWFTYTPNTTSSPTVTASAAYFAGMNTSSRVSVDGLNHVWAGTQLPVTTGVYAFAAMYWNGTAAVALSPPSTGTVTCSTTACLTNGGFQHANITAPILDSAIDESGNVWGMMASNTTYVPNGLVMLVGAAAPVITPLVNNLP